MFRKIARGMKTVRGAILSLIAIGFVGLVFIPNLLIALTGSGPTASVPLEFVPFFLLAYFLMSLVTSAGDRAIYFSPSEIDFLFAGPFSRRELLVYKIVVFLLSSLFISIVISFATIRHFPNFWCVLAGTFLVFVFMILSSMFFTLVGQIVAEHAYTRVRKCVGLSALALLALAMAQVFKGLTTFEDFALWLREIRETVFGSIVLWPFEIYSGIMTAESPGSSEFLTCLLMGVGLNAGLIAAILVLDANYLETATRVSQKVFDQLQRARSGGMSKASSRTARWRFPMFPFFWGAGPIAWRQLHSAIRKGGNLVMIALIIGGCFSLPVFFDANNQIRNSPRLVGIVLGGLAYVTVVLSMHLPLGFRGDADHLETLKGLPLRKLPIAVGQLLPSILVMSLFGGLIIAVMLVVSPGFWGWWCTALVFLGPFNGFVFGLADTIFLLYPVRVAGGAKDIQAMGQAMLFMMLQMMLLTFCLVVIGIAAGLVYVLFSDLLFTLVVGWLGLALAAIGASFLSAWAFGRYDASRHQPV